MARADAISLYLPLVMFASLIDFALNTIYDPYLGQSLFITVIICMAQMVTILLHFFSWFYIISSLSQVQKSGDSIYKQFLPLVITTLTYIIFFIIHKAVLFSIMKTSNLDLIDLWNNAALLTLWTIQRFLAVVHYSFSMLYIIRIISEPARFF